MALTGIQSSRMAQRHEYPHLICTFMLAFVLLVLKSPDALSTPQFWAEDGAVFFAEQFQHDWPRLLTPYAGYLHTVTRLVAWIASGFKVLHAPLIYTALAILIDAACVAYVSLRMTPWFSRWAVFLSFFIIPSSGDIFGTVTNVQWFMQFVLAAACLTPTATVHKSRWELRVAGYFVLALVALSGPFSIMVAGLGLGAMLMGRLPVAPTGHARPGGISNSLTAVGAVGRGLSTTNLLIVGGGACIQMTVVLTNKVAVSGATFFLSPQLQASLGVAKLRSFYEYTVEHAFLAPHVAFMAGMIAIVTACLVHTLIRPARWNGVACLFLTMGVAQPLLAYMKEHSASVLTSTSRYFFMLSVVCCWVAWNMLSEYFSKWRPVVIPIAALVLVVGISAHLEYFHRETLHDLNWPKYADQIRNGGAHPVVVPINPPPWHFELNTR